MTKITETIPVEVYETVHGVATARQTSVSTLTLDYVTSLLAPGQSFDDLVAEQNAIVARVHERGGGFPASEREPREAVYTRETER
jgi:hypothetical protein